MKKPKILFDISHTIHGNTGIQQDVRWLLQILYDLGYNISLLIYDMVDNHEFIDFNIEKSLKESGEIITQAKLLSYYFNSGVKVNYKARFPFGLLRRLRHENYLIKNEKFKLVKLNERYNEIIYRNLLSNGIEGKYLDNIKKSDIYITNLSSEGFIKRMNQSKFNLMKIDTTKFDIAIFAQEFPIIMSKNTTKIVRSYDLIQIFGSDVVVSADYKANYQFKSIKECVKQKAWFVPISKFIANEIKEVFGDYKRIFTIPCTISNVFVPQKNSCSIIDIINKYSKKRFHDKQIFDYILSVSTIEPRKNIVRLYQAYKRVKNKYKNLKFILIGKKGWLYDNKLEQIWLDEDVINLQDVSTADLPVLYSNAKALTYIPFFEGFGLPAIEAMACGCPVISSDIPVHREIQGENAFYVNPYDMDDITDSISFVLNSKNKKIVCDRVKKGLKHVETYRLNNIKNRWKEFINNKI